MHAVESWLGTLPAVVIYLLIFSMIGIESLGIPLPGEITLVTGALLAATGVTNVWWVAAAGSLGAIIGDSVGYAIGRRGGRKLLERLGRRFPRHLGPPQLARAERTFERWGVWAVFFGRFVALLRILAGPLSGALRVRYWKFLLANASGGIVWASGTTVAIYLAGRVAEKWLQSFSWVALAVAVCCGILSTLYLRRRARHAVEAELGDGSERAAPANPAAVDPYGIELDEIELDAAELDAPDVDAADLRAADLDAADLGAAELDAADLEAGDLRAAHLGAAYLGGSEIGAGEMDGGGRGAHGATRAAR